MSALQIAVWLSGAVLWWFAVGLLIYTGLAVIGLIWSEVRSYKRRRWDRSDEALAQRIGESQRRLRRAGAIGERR